MKNPHRKYLGPLERDLQKSLDAIVPVSHTTGIKGLLEWIKTKTAEGSFSGCKSVDDIASLAIACGFDRGAIAQWQVSEKFKGLSDRGRARCKAKACTVEVNFWETHCAGHRYLDRRLTDEMRADVWAKLYGRAR